MPIKRRYGINLFRSRATITLLRDDVVSTVADEAAAKTYTFQPSELKFVDGSAVRQVTVTCLAYAAAAATTAIEFELNGELKKSFTIGTATDTFFAWTFSLPNPGMTNTIVIRAESSSGNITVSDVTIEGLVIEE